MLTQRRQEAEHYSDTFKHAVLALLIRQLQALYPSVLYIDACPELPAYPLLPTSQQLFRPLLTADAQPGPSLTPYCSLLTQLEALQATHTDLPKAYPMAATIMHMMARAVDHVLLYRADQTGIQALQKHCDILSQALQLSHPLTIQETQSITALAHHAAKLHLLAPYTHWLLRLAPPLNAPLSNETEPLCNTIQTLIQHQPSSTQLLCYTIDTQARQEWLLASLAGLVAQAKLPHCLQAEIQPYSPFSQDAQLGVGVVLINPPPDFQLCMPPMMERIAELYFPHATPPVKIELHWL